MPLGLSVVQVCMSKETCSTVPESDDEWFSAVCVPITVEEHSSGSIWRKGEMYVLPEDAAQRELSGAVWDDIAERTEYVIWESSLTRDNDERGRGLPKGFNLVWESQPETVKGEADISGFRMNSLVTNEYRGDISVSLSNRVEVVGTVSFTLLPDGS